MPSVAKLSIEAGAKPQSRTKGGKRKGKKIERINHDLWIVYG